MYRHGAAGKASDHLGVRLLEIWNGTGALERGELYIRAVSDAMAHKKDNESRLIVKPKDYEQGWRESKVA